MILVTGAAGYIGSHFIKYYQSQNPGAYIAAVDNLSEGHRESLPYDQHLQFFQQDISNTAEMKNLLTALPIKTVVHFAGSCYVGESQTNPIKYFQNNVANSICLFKAMEECHVKQIIFSSSCATYGNPAYSPIDEDHPQNPINVYGLTKLMVEKTLDSLATNLGWSYIALRYFNAAGADESLVIGESHNPETHLIPRILQTAAGKVPFAEIHGDDYETADGTCVRDYIHVNDLAEAHYLALTLLENDHEKRQLALNLGTSTGYSIKAVIASCKKITGAQIPVKTVSRRSGDAPTLVANASKAAALLNWRPKYDLNQIIETAWHWEQNRRY